ncbi:MAG: hypothetical protein FRC54_00360 [bacterium LCO1.1]|uniref:Uncharacterized protein n=1 Tax=Candidatus Weimeria bifida TaxID=2599074 RepID=A0A6N7IYM2_9FIRM|nr:hypothetical protein [Candidatus Weimeria bifida]
MSDPLHYRNKAQIPVGMQPDGGIVMGFYAHHSHRIIEPDQSVGCLIGAPENQNITDAIKS